MRKIVTYLILLAMGGLLACVDRSAKSSRTADKTAAEILSDPNYKAICYGGYREESLDVQPTMAELKEDMKLMHAMGIRIVRTYKLHLPHAANLVKAISELKAEDPEFEMYVMLGAWIDAKYAWTDREERIRYEDAPRNEKEINRAVELANEYPDIVKIIAVGNEAMVHWQSEYYVEPGVILGWVQYLQELKAEGKLPKDIWITSSDNFASWGGGGAEYHKEDLNELIRSVDYISMHTYPMHDTHYNPVFWGIAEEEKDLPKKEQVKAAMLRSRDYAASQYESVVAYMDSLGVDKPVHIGETGWSTVSNEFYGDDGAKAIDEYKSGLYYDLIHEWGRENNVTIFYFEAFDEKWKDAQNPEGSENHFGLINLRSQAKYPIWDLVDQGVFNGLTRDGKPITKTFDGDMDSLMQTVSVPPVNPGLTKAVLQD